MIKQIMALSALFLFAHSANAFIIDFEDVQAGTIVDDEYAAMGITFSAINFDNGLDLAVVFDTNNPTGGDHDLEGPFAPGPGNTFGSISPGNVLILQENDNCDANSCSEPDDEGSRPAGRFIIEFATAINLLSIDFFDVELPEAGPGEDNRISLFDANGDQIQLDFFTPETGGDNQWYRTMFNVNNVARIEINMGGSGAIDNLEFTAVPLPAGLPLILSALAGLGLMRRR